MWNMVKEVGNLGKYYIINFPYEEFVDGHVAVIMNMSQRRSLLWKKVDIQGKYREFNAVPSLGTLNELVGGIHTVI